jgi:hypothetical protein
MLPKTHIIGGFFLTLILFLIFPQITWFYALVIFISSFLIDFDHYLAYAYEKKRYNPWQVYKTMIDARAIIRKIPLEKRLEYKHLIMIFHGIEFWVVLALLIFVHKIFLFILIGIAIHMMLDFIDLYLSKAPFYIKLSVLYTHHKNKGKKPFD